MIFFDFNINMNLYTQYLDRLKTWWWPPPPQLSPVEAFRAQLQSSNLNFNTKHSDSKIIVQRLCMMFSQLISELIYSNFMTSLQPPLQFPYNQPTDRIPNIFGKIKIQTERIKCQLTLTMVIDENFQLNFPNIYIRNNEPMKMQPNPKFQSLYESVIGGVRIREKQLEKLYNGKWSEYTKSNIINLVKLSDQLVRKYFPFVKKINKQTDKNNQIVSQLKQKLNHDQLLESIQNLAILSHSIDSQNDHLKQENIKLKKLLNIQQQPYKEELFRVEEGQSQQVLELVCALRATEDTLAMMEEEFMHKNPIYTYELMVEKVKELSEVIFQIRYKLSLLTDE